MLVQLRGNGVDVRLMTSDTPSVPLLLSANDGAPQSVWQLALRPDELALHRKQLPVQKESSACSSGSARSVCKRAVSIPSRATATQPLARPIRYLLSGGAHALGESTRGLQV
jgi:hypothetical protein